MILYMFHCHSPKSSPHHFPLPQSPKDCYIHTQTEKYTSSPEGSGNTSGPGPSAKEGFTVTAIPAAQLLTLLSEPLLGSPHWTLRTSREVAREDFVGGLAVAFDMVYRIAKQLLFACFVFCILKSCQMFLC